MNSLITICARGGSKGIPGKNIKMLNGFPLLTYTINVAKQFAKVHGSDIAVSTDDSAIQAVAADYGIYNDYSRPAHLATDTAGKIDTIRDLLNFQESRQSITYDFILDLDVTSPLRTLEDLLNAQKLLFADKYAVNLFSVNNAARNPYFNMVEKKENNYYNLVKGQPGVMTRQTAPLVYDLNASFYFYKRQFFTLDLKNVFTDKSLIYLMPHICFDLDHSIDFEFLDFLLKYKKLDFCI
ncbi:acylneuraminate cytidylyltransferase family protein [Daejeonella sp.]|uniref:acylneuraminate cytidylyltransferase family protein n=1 Tax=Daejeonella sp. TaxID=2805397 RepID=UPI0030BBD583